MVMSLWKFQLCLCTDWNDVNNIDIGSNIELDGKTYTTDTTIRVSGLIDNPNFQIAIGAITANYILGEAPNSENISWWKSV